MNDSPEPPRTSTPARGGRLRLRRKLAELWRGLGPLSTKITMLVAIIALINPYFLDWLKRPNLSIEPSSTYVDYPGDYRFLRASVKNQASVPWLAWFIRGDAALNCQAKVSFFGKDETELFQFLGRWSNTPLPIVTTRRANPQGGYTEDNVYDSSRVPLGRTIDISPGAAQDLDIAVKFQGEAEAYGFTNENYISNNSPSTERWRSGRYLPDKRHLIRVSLTCEGVSFGDTLTLFNETTELESFRLK